MGQEPDTLFFYGGNMLAASQVQEAFMKVAMPRMIPTLLHSSRSPRETAQPGRWRCCNHCDDVKEGDSVVDDAGNPATLTAKTAEAAGTLVRPAGCRAADCAVEYDGTNVTEMDQMSAHLQISTRSSSGRMAPRLKASDSVYSFNLGGSPDVPNATATCSIAPLLM